MKKISRVFLAIDSVANYLNSQKANLNIKHNVMHSVKMDAEKEILIVLKENPEGLTITDIAAKVGLSRNTVSKYIYGLVKAGKVYQRRIGVVSICYLKEYSDKIKKVLGER